MRIILLFTIILFLNACKDSKGKKPESKENNEAVLNCVDGHKPNEVKLNFNILLDLSDRIDTVKFKNQTMQFYQRDLGYIVSISEAFQCHALNKRYQFMDERMSVYFHPNPQSASVNNMINQLKLKIDRNSTKESITNISSTYNNVVPKIYYQALADKSYVGSDTWDFFNTKLKDYNIIRSGYRNVLVLLTDGYMFYGPTAECIQNQCNYITSEKIKSLGLNVNNWQQVLETKKIGIKPASNNLSELKVLVLGINPSNSKYDKAILNRLWSNWFTSMGILEKNFRIIDADLPANLDETIKSFILKD